MGKNSYVVLAFHQIIIIALGALAFYTTGSVKRIIMWIVLVVMIEIITRYTPWVLGRKSVNQKIH